MGSVDLQGDRLLKAGDVLCFAITKHLNNLRLRLALRQFLLPLADFDSMVPKHALPRSHSIPSRRRRLSSKTQINLRLWNSHLSQTALKDKIHYFLRPLPAFVIVVNDVVARITDSREQVIGIAL